MPRRGTDVRSLHARRKTIAKAFAELRQRGFLALQRHTCCRSCGWYEVPEDQEHVVFYHEQDWHASTTARPSPAHGPAESRDPNQSTTECMDPNPTECTDRHTGRVLVPYVR